MRLSMVVASILVAGLASAQQADPGDLIRQGRKLNSEGRQDQAIAAYREALSRSPDSYDALYGLGIALDLADREGEGRESFARASERAPADSRNQALTAMAVSYAFSGDARGSSNF